jgi:hypothetical protein
LAELFFFAGGDMKRWRAEFEKLGYNTVRDDMATGGLRVIGGTLEKQQCARKWLQEQEAEQSKARVQDRKNAQWGLRIACIALVVSVLSLLVALWK